jgi:hypothetical protein
VFIESLKAAGCPDPFVQKLRSGDIIIRCGSLFSALQVGSRGLELSTGRIVYPTFRFFVKSDIMSHLLNKDQSAFNVLLDAPEAEEPVLQDEDRPAPQQQADPCKYLPALQSNN